jgi:hypothetical protein
MEQMNGMRFPSEAAAPRQQQLPQQATQLPGREYGRQVPDHDAAGYAQAPPQRHEASPPRKPAYEPANTGLQLGLDKQSEAALKRAKQEEYRRQLDAERGRGESVPALQSAVVDSTSYLHTGVRPAPARVEPAQAIPSEAALKRAKQEEYRRQQDAERGRGDYVPALQSAVVDSASYLHTGVRPAPARVAPSAPAQAVQSEAALKRAKQEEYRRLLDAERGRGETIPALQSAIVDSSSYLHTGVRPAPAARGAAAPANPYYSTGGPAAALPDRGPPDYAQPAYPSYRERDAHHLSGQYPVEQGHRDVRDSVAPMQHPGAGYGLDPQYARQEQRAPPRAYPTDTAPYDARDPYLRQRGYEPSVGPSPAQRSDPYSQQANYSNAPYGQSAPPARHQDPGRGPTATQAGTETAGEKERKRLEQESYRRMLEQQVAEQKVQKDLQKKQLEEEDKRFLQTIGAANVAEPGRRKKAPGGAAAAPPAPVQQAAQSALSEPPRGSQGYGPSGPARGPPPAVPGPASRFEDDVAEQYAYMQARGMLPGGQGFESDGGSEAGDRYGDRGPPAGAPYGGPRRTTDDAPPRDMDREFRDRDHRRAADERGPYAARGADRDPHADMQHNYGSAGGVDSPSKSPNQARTRFMQDIYGSDLISHDPAKNLVPEAVGGERWKPSKGGAEELVKRNARMDQRAALDAQKADNDARRKREKEEEEERAVKKAARDREATEREEEAKRAEERKVSAVHNPL